MTNIVDGYGSGYGARVGSDNRLWTYSSSTPAGVVASVNNKAWTVASTDITCTSDNESALLHLKYLGSYKLVVSALYLTAGASTGGSGNVEFRTYRNPTGGTIVTDESAAEVGPKNFSGSASSLIGNSYAGTEGKTTTGGVNIARGRFSTTGLVTVDLQTNPYILEAGNSIAFTVIPPTGNTSQVNRILIETYELVNS